MAKMYYGNIDVTKIDRTKLFIGKKGKYLDVVVWINDEPDNYGNKLSIIQGQDKDDPSPKVYLGNLKEHVPQGAPQAATKPDMNTDLLPDEEPPF